MLGGTCRAERGDGVLESGLGQRDHVHVALDDECVAALADGRAGLEQTVELAALHEHRRLGRVEVFRLASIQYAAAEADHRSLDGTDRKHDPVAEAVVAFARNRRFTARRRVGRLCDDKTAFLEQRVVVFGEDARQGSPALGGIAHAEPQRDLAAQTTALQIRHGALASAQLAPIALGSLGQHVTQSRLALLLRDSLFALGYGTGVFRHGHAGLLRQVTNGVDEARAVLLHQEAHCVAVHATTEAVVGLSRGAYGEARRLLAVEWAEPFPGGASSFEFD